jgi:flagellar basal-body rod protein FlgB
MTGIPLLNILRDRMSWLNGRQSVLSQNVANADTPGYEARDLKAVNFDRLLQQSAGASQFSTPLELTNARHIAVQPVKADSFKTVLAADTESNPTGNTVSLEQQMIKVADTQAQYRAASNLYAKAISMMRTAIGH